VQIDRLRQDPAEAGAADAAIEGRAFCWVLVSLIVCEQVAFGGNGSGLGLLFAIASAVLLLCLLVQRWGRSAFERKNTLVVPGFLFACAAASMLVALTPLASQSNAPIWSAIGAQPSASINHQALIVDWIKLVGLALVFASAYACGRDRRKAQTVLRAIVILGVPFAVFSLALHIFSPTNLFGYEVMSGPDRLSATLPSANVAGTLFGLLLLCAASVLSQQWKAAQRRSKFAARQVEHFLRTSPAEIAGCLLSAACLISTASRTALAATGASLILLLLWEALGGRFQARRWFVPLTVVLGLAVVIGLGGDVVANRYLQSGQDFQTRLTIFQAHWQAYESSIWLGSGLGSFGDLNRMFANKINFSDLSLIGAAHNVYLQWLEQTGLIGSILMWSCLGWLFVMIALALRRQPRLSGLLRLALSSSVLVLTHGLTDFSLEAPSIAALWALLLGLAAGRAA